MATTRIGDRDYIDMKDIHCPKCGSDDFEWKNMGSYPDGNTWHCTCAECGHEYTVIEESFYRIEEE